MKTSPILTFLLTLLVVPSSALAQEEPFVLQGRPLSVYPLLDEAFAKGDEFWKEDLEKVTEATRLPTTPARYRTALRTTGMADYLASASLATPTDRSAWTLRGPIGGTSATPRNGRIAGIQIIHPSDSTPTVFVGSCQGGLWKAQNSDLDGGVWENLGTLLPNPSVRAFAVDPDDADHIVVGTGDHSRYDGAGIYVTYDSGASWHARATPVDPKWFYRVIFQNRMSSPVNQYVIAASSSGLFRSEDGGLSWAFAQFADGSDTDGMWTDLLEHPDNPALLYACVSRYSSGSYNGIYRSVDYGETWTQMADATLPQDGDWVRASLAICRDVPSTLAVLVTGGGVFQGVYKSTNNAGSWTDITADLGGFGGDQIGHAQAISIRPDNPDQIFLGAVFLAMTVDGGATWTLGSETGINWGHDDITQLYFSDVISDQALWICNDGGVYYHDFTNGGHYSFIGGPVTGLACSEIDNMDADRNWRVIGLQDNGIYFSEDKGITWVDQSTGDGADVEIYDTIDGDYMYNSGVFNDPPDWHTFRKPYGSGVEYWTTPGNASTPRLQSEPGTGLMVTHDETTIYTVDAESGTAWTPVLSGLKPGPYLIRDLNVSLAGDATWYVNYWDSHPRDVTVVRDVPGQGRVISQVENLGDPDQRLVSLTPSREWPGEFWVTLVGDPQQSKILHTTDYGITWSDITGNLADVAIVEGLEVHPFNPLMLYAGTNLGMFRSMDGGLSWDPFQEGLPIGRCRELRFVIDPFGTNHSLELAMDGRGLWTRPMILPRVLFVDRASTLAEAGTREHPYHSINTAVLNAPIGAVIAVKANEYLEPYIYNKGCTVMTWGGGTIVR